MKYQFSTECTWLYLFLRTVRRAKILYPRTSHDIDLRQAPNRYLFSTLATPAKRGSIDRHWAGLATIG
jgi:hypothetical protein